jgi:hypothetical protein
MTKPFIKYHHLERIGATEVQGIELGECFVFPKIDGTNSSLWVSDGELQAGSRNRLLSLESDNAGFFTWAQLQENLKRFFAEFPDYRLYGEWLVPHSLKTYRSEAWRKFYVFDITDDDSENPRHIPYNDYQPILNRFGIDYIPPICQINNGSYEQFINQLLKNVFLIEDGKGTGEGIVIKNYDYRNKFGRQTWAKIVTSEFKETHAKEMGSPIIQGKKLIEEEIAAKFVTTALVDKEFAKIESVDGWSSKFIPRLLNTVYYSVVKEESWEFVKEHKNPTIDFKRLQHFVFGKVKQCKPELF